MRTLIIDLRDVGGKPHPEDYVLLQAPALRGSVESTGAVIMTAPVHVDLTDGKAEVQVEPGPLLVQIRTQSVRDSGPLEVIVPEGTGPVSLRTRIEPWLTSLFQSEPLSLLTGSGLTNAVQSAAGIRPDNGMGAGDHFTVFAAEINQAADKMAMAANRGARNIEDEIRAANDLIRGLDIIKDMSGLSELPSSLRQLQKDLNAVIESFTNSISEGEHCIASAPKEQRERAFHELILFLMSFASRTGTRDRLHIFTTNYDRLIEAGADLAGLRLIDRFVGALSPIFRSSRMDVDMHYNPPGIRGEPRYLEGVARFTKLHGSLDWINVEGELGGDDQRRAHRDRR